MSLESDIRHLVGEYVDEKLAPVWAAISRLEDDMTSAQSAQDALNADVAEIGDDITAVANELASVIQQNQAGQLSATQVNEALAPIHQRLANLLPATTPTADPSTNTDPTNSPAPDSPAVNPAPDAPTDEPTPDPTVNPVDVNPASQPADNTDPNAIPQEGSGVTPDNSTDSGFQQDV